MSSDNIKVVVRARPHKKSNNYFVPWIIDEKKIYQIDEDKTLMGEIYSYDEVFNVDTKNVDIYGTAISSLASSAIEGINLTIFAYGATSSGKTYTMNGTPEDPGIIPRFIEHIFDQIELYSERKFLIRVSYVEIYSETINDLLDKTNKDLKIREDINNCVSYNPKEQIVKSTADCMQAMKMGAYNRTVGETQMNQCSSRSHAIFRIVIESALASGGENDPVQVSHVNLIDLAGSERVSQTGATGQRFKEGAHINKSLTALGLVMKQLVEKNEYVNYRDSKLTRILSNSLGGNAKTLIICNINLESIEDTASTLMFAQRAKAVKNKPKVNEVVTEAALTKKYAKDCAEIKKQLESELEKNKQLEVERDMSNKKISELDSRIKSLQEIFVKKEPVIRPPKRRHTFCTLKAISEDRELENASRNLITVGLRGDGDMSRSSSTLESALSPPRRNSVNGLEIDKSSDNTPTKNLRDRLEILTREHEELIEYTRLEKCVNKAMTIKFEQFKNERNDLKSLAEARLIQLKSEEEKAQQIKVDYEFILENQKKNFERRESELLEQINKCSTKIEIEQPTSIENLPLPNTLTLNIFEYEEMSEKLASCKKQIEEMQNSSQTLKLENEDLNVIIADLRKSVNSLELQNSQLKIKNKSLQNKVVDMELKVNKSLQVADSSNNDIDSLKKQIQVLEGNNMELKTEMGKCNEELFESQDKLMEVTEDLDIEEKRSSSLKMQLNEEKELRQNVEDKLHREEELRKETESDLGKERSLRQETESELLKERALRQEYELELLKERTFRQEIESELLKERTSRQKTEAKLDKEKPLRQEIESEILKEKSLLKKENESEFVEEISSLSQENESELLKERLMRQEIESELNKERSMRKETEAELVKEISLRQEAELEVLKGKSLLRKENESETVEVVHLATEPELVKQSQLGQETKSNFVEAVQTADSELDAETLFKQEMESNLMKEIEMRQKLEVELHKEKELLKEVEMKYFEEVELRKDIEVTLCTLEKILKPKCQQINLPTEKTKAIVQNKPKDSVSEFQSVQYTSEIMNESYLNMSDGTIFNTPNESMQEIDPENLESFSSSYFKDTSKSNNFMNFFNSFVSKGDEESRLAQSIQVKNDEKEGKHENDMNEVEKLRKDLNTMRLQRDCDILIINKLQAQLEEYSYKNLSDTEKISKTNKIMEALNLLEAEKAENLSVIQKLKEQSQNETLRFDELQRILELKTDDLKRKDEEIQKLKEEHISANSGLENSQPILGDNETDSRIRMEEIQIDPDEITIMKEEEESNKMLSSGYKEKIEELLNIIKRLNNEMENLSISNKNKERIIQEIKDELINSEKEKRDLSSKINDLIIEAQMQTSNLAELNALIENKELNIQKVVNDNKLLQEERNNIRSILTVEIEKNVELLKNIDASENISSSLKEKETIIAKINEEKKALTLKINNLCTQMEQQKEKEISNQNEEKCIDLKTKINELQNEIVNLSMVIQNKEKIIVDIDLDRTSLQNEKVDLSDKIDDLMSQVQTQTNSLIKLQNIAEIKELDFEKVIKENALLKIEREQMNSTLKEEKKKNADLLKSIQNLEDKLEIRSSSAKENEMKFSELKKEYDKLSAAIKDKDVTIDSIEKEKIKTINKMKDEIETLSIVIQNKEKIIDDIDSERTNLQKEKIDLYDKINDLLIKFQMQTNNLIELEKIVEIKKLDSQKMIKEIQLLKAEREQIDSTLKGEKEKNADLLESIQELEIKLDSSVNEKESITLELKNNMSNLDSRLKCLEDIKDECERLSISIKDKDKTISIINKEKKNLEKEEKERINKMNELISQVRKQADNIADLNAINKNMEVSSQQIMKNNEILKREKENIDLLLKEERGKNADLIESIKELEIKVEQLCSSEKEKEKVILKINEEKSNLEKEKNNQSIKINDMYKICAETERQKELESLSCLEKEKVLMNRIKKLETKIEKLSKDVKSKENTMTFIKEDKINSEVDRRDLINKITHLMAQVQTKTDQLVEQNEIMGNKELSSQKIMKENEILKRKIEQIDSTLMEERQKNASLIGNLQELEIKLEKLLLSEKEKEMIIVKVNTEKSELEEQINCLSKKLNDSSINFERQEKLLTSTNRGEEKVDIDRIEEMKNEMEKLSMDIQEKDKTIAIINAALTESAEGFLNNKADLENELQDLKDLFSERLSDHITKMKSLLGIKEEKTLKSWMKQLKLETKWEDLKKIENQLCTFMEGATLDHKKKIEEAEIINRKLTRDLKFIEEQKKFLQMTIDKIRREHEVAISEYEKKLQQEDKKLKSMYVTNEHDKKKIENLEYELKASSKRSKPLGNSNHISEKDGTEFKNSEGKWKQQRAEAHDSRRSIDLNTLCNESTAFRCRCESMDKKIQEMKLEISQLKEVKEVLILKYEKTKKLCRIRNDEIHDLNEKLKKFT